MTSNSWLGMVALAVGIALLIFGINASESPLESISETLTGRFTNSTMWLIIGGIGAIVGGAVLIGAGRR
jgi:multisubunit Na+/H+ antiporter MnhB subunit